MTEAERIAMCLPRGTSGLPTFIGAEVAHKILDDSDIHGQALLAKATIPAGKGLMVRNLKSPSWIKYLSEHAEPNAAKTTLTCNHRGIRVGNNFGANVYRCEQHAFCTISRDRGLPTCAECQQRTPRTRESRGPVIITCTLGLGDLTCLSGAIRDLHRAHPGRFSTAVESHAASLFEHNPLILPLSDMPPDAPRIAVQCESWDYPAMAHQHFAYSWRKQLGDLLSVDIPLTELSGDLRLSQNETNAPPPCDGPYWILFAGGKGDFETKWWPQSHWQKAVDHFRGKLTFIRVGSPSGWNPPLQNVIDVVGRTNHRDIMRMCYRASGVLSPVSWGMHLAASLPTPDGKPRAAVVISGAREEDAFIAYPHHAVLSNIGSLPCCASGACWKSLTMPGKFRDRDCAMPIQLDPKTAIAQCMMNISPESVIEAIERYA